MASLKSMSMYGKRSTRQMTYMHAAATYAQHTANLRGISKRIRSVIWGSNAHVTYRSWTMQRSRLQVLSLYQLVAAPVLHQVQPPAASAVGQRSRQTTCFCFGEATL